jgi:hypothetical protein
MHVGEREDLIEDSCAKLFSFKGVRNTELLVLAESGEVIRIHNE